MFPHWPSNAHHLSHLEGHAAKRAAKRRLPRVRVLVVGVSRKAEVERLRWTSLTCAAHVVRWGFLCIYVVVFSLFLSSVSLFLLVSFICIVVFFLFYLKGICSVDVYMYVCICAYAQVYGLCFSTGAQKPRVISADTNTHRYSMYSQAERQHACMRATHAYIRASLNAGVF